MIYECFDDLTYLWYLGHFRWKYNEQNGVLKILSLPWTKQNVLDLKVNFLWGKGSFFYTPPPPFCTRTTHVYFAVIFLGAHSGPTTPPPWALRSTNSATALISCTCPRESWPEDSTTWIALRWRCSRHPPAYPPHSLLTSPLRWLRPCGCSLTTELTGSDLLPYFCIIIGRYSNY